MAHSTGMWLASSATEVSRTVTAYFWLVVTYGSRSKISNKVRPDRISHLILFSSSVCNHDIAASQPPERSQPAPEEFFWLELLPKTPPSSEAKAVQIEFAGS